MASDRYYKLWLRNSADSAWLEVEKFSDLKFSHVINGIPSMSATVYTRNATLQTLLKSTSGPIRWRITKLDSTTGANGTLILDGKLKDCMGDMKSKTPGTDNPVVWSLTGVGMLAMVQEMTYRTSNKADPVAAAHFPDNLTDAAVPVGTTIVDDIIDDLITNGDAVEKGVIDAGSSVHAYIREDFFLNTLSDLATIGDATTKSLYYVFGTAGTTSHNSVKVHFLKPDHSATYVGPSHTGFTVSNPFTGPDNARILNQRTQLENFEIRDDQERVINSLKVQVGGFGSGVERLTTADGGHNNAASIASTLKRREKTINAPFLTTVASGDILANTVLNMYQGVVGVSTFPLFTPIAKQVVGIGMAQGTLRKGELYDPNGFNAQLGDFIGVTNEGTNQCWGLFSGFGYEQSTSKLTVFIGTPRGGNAMKREWKRAATGISRTGVVAPEVLTSSSGGTSTSTVSPNSFSSYRTMTFTANWDIDDHEAIEFYISTQVNESRNVNYLVMVEMDPDPGSYTSVMQYSVFHVNGAGSYANIVPVRLSREFLTNHVGNVVTGIRVRVYNDDGVNSNSFTYGILGSVRSIYYHRHDI